MEKYVFKLYITGNTIRSKNAVTVLTNLCREKLSVPYEIKIIDVLEDPAAAEEDKIFATPTLIKEMPPPIQRIIGDLTITSYITTMFEPGAKNQ